MVVAHPSPSDELNRGNSNYPEDGFECDRANQLISEEKSWRKLIDLVAAANGDLIEDEINMSLMIEREVDMMRYENCIF